jgi:hypothetical protein
MFTKRQDKKKSTTGKYFGLIASIFWQDDKMLG